MFESLRRKLGEWLEDAVHKIYNRVKLKLSDPESGPLIQSWGMENTLKLLYPVIDS